MIIKPFSDNLFPRSIQLFDVSATPFKNLDRRRKAGAPQGMKYPSGIGEQSHPAADCLFRYLKVSSV